MKYSKRKHRLSAHGRLAVYVGLAVCTMQAYAQNIVPADGNTSVEQQNSVDIVNIVKPTEQGLSHNTYNQFDVSTHGAVMNNATAAAQSKLVGGNVAANANLAGSSAAVILNEVVSNKSSSLRGKQEILGAPADLVLANPNGITCKDCGFINTNRSSLVVGKPVVSGGQLQGHDIQSNTSGKALNVSGTVSADKVLDLIAPKVDINGDVSAKDEINVLIGKRHAKAAQPAAGGAENTAPEDSSENIVPVAKKAGQPAAGKKQIAARNQQGQQQVLDGSVVGSMHAGRIRIHSSEENSATRISAAKLTAEQLIDVNAQGVVRVSGSELAGGDVSLSGKDLSINGQKNVTTSHEPTENVRLNAAQWWELPHMRTAETSVKEDTYKASSISGKAVTLNAAQTAEITATVKADKLDVNGGNVLLSSAKTDHNTTRTVRETKGAWFNQKQEKEKAQKLHANNFDVSGDVSINARSGNANLQAANINAGGNISVSAAQDLQLEGALTGESKSSVGSYQNETAKLKTGSNTVSSESEQFNATALQAGGNVNLQAGYLKASGASMKAGADVVVNAREADFDTAQSNESSLRDNHFKYWGGIGGGETDATSSHKMTKHGTTIESAGQVAIQTDDKLSLKATTVKGGSDVTLASQTADVVIANDMNQATTESNKRHGTAFNITDRNHKGRTKTDEVVSSSINAGGKIGITASKTASIVGSQVIAGTALNIRADSITSDIADAHSEVVTEDYTLGFRGYTRWDGTAIQGTAGARLEGVTRTVGKGTGKATASQLQGTMVTLGGQKEVALKGSQINATSGGVMISAQDINLGAGSSRTQNDQERNVVNGAGIYVSGGLQKIVLGFEAGTDQTHITEVTEKAVATQINSARETVLSASNTVHNSGTQVEAGGLIAVQGKSIHNEAAADVATATKIDGNGGVKLELYVKFEPRIGLGLTFAGKGKNTRVVDSTAQTTHFKGNSIHMSAGVGGLPRSAGGGQQQTAAANQFVDQGTRYTAEGGQVSINAGTYRGEAAESSKVTTIHSGNGTLGLDVSTNDFQSVTAQIGLKGAYQYLQEGDAKAVQGQIKSRAASITAQDSLASSMNIDASESVSLYAAGKDAVVTQANDRQWQHQHGFSGGGTVGVTFVPPNAVAPSLSISAGGNYLKAEHSQARAATINTGELSINAPAAVRTEGAVMNVANLSISGKTVELGAGVDRHKAFGVDASGAASLKLSFAGSDLSGGGVGVSGAFGMRDENNFKENGGSINASGKVNIAASGAEDLKIVGTTINADTLDVRNAGGNVSVVAARHEINKANWGLGADLGVGFNKKGATNFSVGSHLKIDIDKSRYFKNGAIAVKNANIEAGKDLTLQTAVAADALQGKVGGNVAVSSPQNHTNTFVLDIGGSIGGPTSVKALDPKATMKDYLDSFVADVKGGTILGFKVQGRFKFHSDNQRVTQVNDIKVGKLDMNVAGGKVAVTAANVSSQAGSGFGDAKVSKADNKDYVHTVGVNLFMNMPGLPEIIADLIAKKKPQIAGASGTFKWTDDKVKAKVSLAK